MKASPLLRAWLRRLEQQGVRFQLRHDWQGELDGDATVLALGGASWPRLGSNGSWVEILTRMGVEIAAFRPANVGFTVAWSDVFRDRFAGQPLKNVALRFGGQVSRGDAMITRYGIEGGAVYALSAVLRDAIAKSGPLTVEIDLRPEQPAEQIARRLLRPRGKDSRSNFLRKALNLSPLEISLLRETDTGERIKSLPLTLIAPQPLARAISTAGGVSFDAVDESLMLKALPNVYVVGEMLDWEAPTGGYLLQACFATGAFAAHAILSKIES
jgi:uncharacterized flavoprotein (TIGR03862 family)